MKTTGKRPEGYSGNPKPYPGQPVEITLKTERLDESSLIPLAPGVTLVGQISKTGKRVPVTHGEQRLFLCLQNDEGKRVQFYQSFAGTGGKQQGSWFPTGGVMADQHGRGAWIIKGSPRTDPGCGRVPLLEFCQRVNEVLPHTDPDTDAWLMQLVGMDYGDLSYADEYEIVPFIRITEAGNSNELQKKWGSWCYQFWALMVLDKIWGKRTFTPERVAANPYKAAIPIVSGIALANSGQKSFPPAFWRWFKDSKVTDPYGEPEVVYHGTTSGGFDAFRPNYREGEMLGFGIHFARDRKFADYYTKESDSGRKGGSQPEVYEAYLSIRNPIDFTADKFVEGTPEFTALKHMLDIAVGENETAGLVKRNYDGKKYLEPFLWMLTAELRPSVVERIIRENGFDGVVYTARFLAGSHLAGKRTVAYIVFSPTQVKSATKNSGAYDPRDPRITQNPTGIALENPIPELVKGSRTPYRRYTREWEFLAPVNRDVEFARAIYTLTGVYPANVHVFRALGSGRHWVGVLAFERGEYEDFILYNSAITLQSGKSWSVAENKVLRWFKQPSEEEGHYSETGAGSLEFMRWVLQKMNHFRKVMQVGARSPNSKPIRIKAGWGTPQRERAYAWLTRYGFQKVADAGDGDPAYILDIQYVPKSNPVDLEGRFVPERYLAGLPPELQQQRIRELTQSRDAYKKGDYSELPTDRAARKMGLVKQSKYTTEAKKRGIEYRGDLHDMASRVLRYYGARATSSEVSAFAGALKKSFSKGLAAWKSGGHRPGATAQNWAVARVNSLVVGGKTSWTADKKLFEVLPAEVRAKIESMRTKQNPISVQVQGSPSKQEGTRHSRFFSSKAALARITEQGKDIAQNIKFIVEWDPTYAWKNRVVRGVPGVITLLASPQTVESFQDSVTDLFGDRRETRISPYTAHTILHRLGDKIMPNTDAYTGAYINSPVKREMAKVGYVPDRVEAAYVELHRALRHADYLLGNSPPLVRGKTVYSVKEWMPLVVDTKACREGWVEDAGQAMAELVPYRVLYKKGRDHGVKLLSDLFFVPALEAALTEYIDANMDMLKGYLVEI